MEYCDTDKSGCLTWAEVEDCFKKYADFLTPIIENNNIPLPTEEDFYKMAGKDECLSFEEWVDGMWNPYDDQDGIEEDE